MRRHAVYGIVWILLAGLVSSCGGDDASPTEPEEEVVLHELFVEYAEGVVGTPEPGTHFFPADTAVSYSYESAEGYENLTVVLDNAVTDHAGTIVMSADRQVIAHADEVYVPEPEDEPVADAAHAFATAADKVDAYEKLIEEFFGIAVDTESVARAQSAFARSLGGLSDEAVLAIRKELAGEVFEIGSSNPVAGVAGEGTLPRPDMYWVASIWTPEEDAALAALEFLRLLRENDISGRVRLIYTPGELTNPDLRAQCLMRGIRTLTREGSFASVLGVDPVTLAIAVLSRIAGCYAGAAVSDIGQITGQIAEQFGILSIQNAETALYLSDQMRESRTNNRSVILVGHSSGNMVARQALNYYTMQHGVDRCMMALSIADPLDVNSWGLTERELSGFVVAGERVADIILALGLNFFPRLATSVSRDADTFLNAYEQSVSTAREELFLKALELSQRIRLHSSTQSYLTAEESRDEIASSIAAHVETLRNTDECVQRGAPLSERVFVSTRRSQIDDFGNMRSYLYRSVLHPEGDDELVGVLFSRIDHQHQGVEIATMAVDPSGQVWGVSDHGRHLYHVDTLTADVTFITSTSPSNLSVRRFTFDTRPDSETFGMIYALVEQRPLIHYARINPETGEISMIREHVQLPVLARNPAGILFASDGTLYVATYSLNTSAADYLFPLNEVTGETITSEARTIWYRRPSGKPWNQRGHVIGITEGREGIHAITSTGNILHIDVDVRREDDWETFLESVTILRRIARGTLFGIGSQ